MIPQPGEHAFIAGQNGSGKTAAACCIMARLSQSPVVIYDTKEEPKFSALAGDSHVFDKWDKVKRDTLHGSGEYAVFRPNAELASDPVALDDLLMRHYQELPGVALYIDEAYTFHRHGQAGKGLMAVLTRGRSRGTSLLMSTQRPAWISRFAITEAKHHFIFKLTHREDKKLVEAFIPGFTEFEAPQKFGFWYYSTETNKPQRYSAFTLDSTLDLGQTDGESASGGDTAAQNGGDAGAQTVKTKWF